MCKLCSFWKERFASAFNSDQAKNGHESQLRTTVGICGVIPFLNVVVESFCSAAAECCSRNAEAQWNVLVCAGACVFLQRNAKNIHGASCSHQNRRRIRLITGRAFANRFNLNFDLCIALCFPASIFFVSCLLKKREQAVYQLVEFSIADGACVNFSCSGGRDGVDCSAADDCADCEGCLRISRNFEVSNLSDSTS